MYDPVKLESYRDLRVWQRSMDLAEACYRLTRRFPREELFGLTSQIRRASSGIPANIAEGYGRAHRGEYLQFLRIAQGSLNELETHLLLSVRVEVSSDAPVIPILAIGKGVGRILVTLIHSLERK
jgi:four helix bundle protein